MSKMRWNGAALLAPVPPALVTCGTMERPNVFTAAWTGIVNTHPPKTYVSVRPQRYSYELICDTGEFAVNLPTAELVRAVDYCGVRSGRNEDKFKAQGLVPMPVEEVRCPILQQAPLSLVCRVTQIVALGSHEMFLADIESVYVDERLIDAEGRLCMEKAGLCAYAHGEYFALGQKIGTFGFSVKRRRRGGKQQLRKDRAGK